MPLTITDQLLAGLPALRRNDPRIADLAMDVAAAFDEVALENPQFAMFILEANCKRVAEGRLGLVLL